MVRLYQSESGDLIGTITAAQLQYLVDQLEEQSLDDRDYYIDRATLDWFDEHGVDLALEALLREALGDREGMDIRWTKE